MMHGRYGYEDLFKFQRQAKHPSEIERSSGSGIVYCRKREECEDVAQMLTINGIPTKAYHAGLAVSG